MQMKIDQLERDKRMMKIQVNEGKGEIAKLAAQVEELKLENSGIATDESKMKDHYLQLKQQM